MRSFWVALSICLFIAGGSLPAESLLQAYQNASPGLGYDRLVNLVPGSVYTGGLEIFNERVGIKSHGAIIDLQGDSIRVDGKSVLDLDGCIIINGATGVSIKGSSYSLISQCVFYNNQFGIRFFSETGFIEVMNTILANNSAYGFVCLEDVPVRLHHLDAYQNILGDYAEWCPT